MNLDALSEQELAQIRQVDLESLLQLYLNCQQPDSSRLGWLLRRLAQVATPGALRFVVDHIETLLPVVGDATRYITRAAPHYDGDLTALGNSIVAALHTPVVAHSTYIRLVLIDLFSRVPGLNHVASLTALYANAPAEVRRELVRAAAAGGAVDWLRELKYDFRHFDPWLRRAYLSTLRSLPGDEAVNWLRGVRGQLDGLEKLVLLWGLPRENLRLGDVRLK